ncbi:MAG: protein kinase [Pseudomonadota bacterium]
MAQSLGEIILRLNRIDGDAVEAAARHARTAGMDLGEVLLARQLISEDQLLEAVAEHRGLDFHASIPVTSLAPGLAHVLPPTKAIELHAVPIAMAQGTLIVATCDRRHTGKELALGRLLGQPVQLSLAPRRVIEQTFDALYSAERPVQDVPDTGDAFNADASSVFHVGPHTLEQMRQLRFGFGGQDASEAAGASTQVARRRGLAPPHEDEEPRTQLDGEIGKHIEAELDAFLDENTEPIAEDEPDLFGLNPSAVVTLPPERTLVLTVDDEFRDDEVISEVLELIDVVEEGEAGAAPEPSVGVTDEWYDTTGKTELMRRPEFPGLSTSGDEGEVFGEYRLIRPIGRGGMAEVFEARRTMVAGVTRTVAVKRILPSFSQDEDFVTMFLDEARITAQLSHPGIGQVLDVGKVDDDYFIAMEYLHGRNLETVFKHCVATGLQVPVAAAIYILRQVLDGLDYAHRKRGDDGRHLHIIHRDVSPANVICCFGGEVKLIDFGIARAANKVSQTRVGLIKGKVCYMSPEQIREQPMDRRSDIFAAGILLWELLAGRSLFAGKNDRETIANVARVVVPALGSLRPDLPSALTTLVHWALERDPDQRPEWASDLSDALGKVALGLDDTGPKSQLVAFMLAHFA